MLPGALARACASVRALVCACARVCVDEGLGFAMGGDSGGAGGRGGGVSERRCPTRICSDRVCVTVASRNARLFLARVRMCARVPTGVFGQTGAVQRVGHP